MIKNSLSRIKPCEQISNSFIRKDKAKPVRIEIPTQLRWLLQGSHQTNSLLFHMESKAHTPAYETNTVGVIKKRHHQSAGMIDSLERPLSRDTQGLSTETSAKLSSTSIVKKTQRRENTLARVSDCKQNRDDSSRKSFCQLKVRQQKFDLLMQKASVVKRPLTAFKHRSSNNKVQKIVQVQDKFIGIFVAHKLDGADSLCKVQKDHKTPVHSRAASAACTSSLTVSKNKQSNRGLRRQIHRSLFHNFDIKPWERSSEADLFSDFTNANDPLN